jgi:hypothetical protein
MIVMYWKHVRLGGTVLILAGGSLKAAAGELTLAPQIAAVGSMLFALGCMSLGSGSGHE